MDGSNASSDACDYGCTQSLPLHQKMYVLDFAGGGAVHMLGELRCNSVCGVLLARE